MTVLEDVVYTARKEHGCCVCLGTIGAGDRYHRQRVVYGADAWVAKFHGLCDAAYRVLARELGYWPDYEEGFDPIDEVHPMLLRFFTAISGPLSGDGE